MNMNRQPQSKRPGRRLRALEDALHRTVKFALRGSQVDEFMAYFPAIPDEVVDVVYDAYRQVGKGLGCSSAAFPGVHVVVHLIRTPHFIRVPLIT